MGNRCSGPKPIAIKIILVITKNIIVTKKITNPRFKNLIHLSLGVCLIDDVIKPETPKITRIIENKNKTIKMISNVGRIKEVIVNDLSIINKLYQILIPNYILQSNIWVLFFPVDY